MPVSVNGYPAFAPTLSEANAGFRSEFFGDLAALEAGSWWFRARNDLIAWAAARFASRSSRALEIGCGTGFVLARLQSALPAAELWGSEIFSAGLAIAGERVPAAHLIQMDARAIPFRDYFDLIGAFDVLEHIEEDEAVLAMAHAALRRDGVLIVTVPQHPRLWSPQDVHAGHVRRYTATDLRRRVETAGFDVLRESSFVSLLLPLMVASRMRMRRAAPDGAFDAIDTLRQPRALNLVLRAVMGLEERLIRLGISFPVGGSRLMVARRRAGEDVRP